MFLRLPSYVFVSHEVSSNAQSGSAVYNVSDWLSGVVVSSKPRDVSLLYASDRKLFNVTSPSGSVRLNHDPPHDDTLYSLAVLAEYQPNISVIFLICLKMAAELGTPPIPLPTSGYDEITVQVLENVPVGTVLVEDLGSVVDIRGGRQYDIMSGNDEGLFEIDHVTGNIFTRAEVDYERCRSHRLVVQITVNETDVLVATETAVFAVVILSVDDVNEYRPVFPVPVYRRTVFGSQSSGSFVTTVRAVDQDTGRFGQLRYRPQTPTSSFVVDRTSGHVWLGNPVAMTSRPGDDVIKLGMTVVAEDVGGWADQVNVELTVRQGSTDSEPSFTADTFEFDVEGSATAGHVIGRLSVTGSESALFSVRRPSRYFTVDRHTGRVVVARDLQTSSSADSQVYVVISARPTVACLFTTSVIKVE